ncbi:MAG: LPXTG cell wall anchor domain-containing protein [[Clostridium] leptum]
MTISPTTLPRRSTALWTAGDNVQTGENNNVTIAVVAVMFIAAAGIVVLSVKAKKVRAK